MVQIGLKPTMGLPLAVDETPVDQFNKAIAVTRAARDAGFHSLWMGQHYFAGKRTHWEAIPTLARLIPEAGHMTIGTCILLPPLHHPVLMAEQVAVLDILAGGRFVFGVGLGYREREFHGFGVSKRERAGRFEEALSIIRKLWTEDHVRFDGKYFKINDLTTGTRPLQKPAPPIWIAAHSDPAVKRAARLGDGLLMNPHASVDTLEQQFALYRDSLEEWGKPLPREIASRRDIYIARDRGDAWAEAKREVPEQVRALAGFGQDKELPVADRYDLSQGLESFIESRFIVGEPETCIRQMERYRERAGINHFIFRVAAPGGSLKDRIEKIELIGRDIIPYFARADTC